jgi:hypothetical protein
MKGGQFVGALAAALLAAATVSSAQSDRASLSGHVSAHDAPSVSGLRVSAVNDSTLDERSTMTDAKGFYEIYDLVPGAYSLHAGAPKYAEAMVKLALRPGEQHRADLNLLPIESGRIITKPSGASKPKSNGSATGGVADTSTVRDLPSNGRDWTQAATLQAGVNSVRTQPDPSNTSSGRGQRGFGGQISVSGGRPQQNNYILNGTSINDYANSAPGSVLGLDLGADAVEQFSVMTSNYPARERSSSSVIRMLRRICQSDKHLAPYIDGVD